MDKKNETMNKYESISRVPNQLIDQTVVELPMDYATAVKRLKEQNGRKTDFSINGFSMKVHTYGLGSFRVIEKGLWGQQLNSRLVKVTGGLYEEEGKTKAVVYTHCEGTFKKEGQADKSAVLKKLIFQYLFYIALLVVGVLLLFSGVLSLVGVLLLIDILALMVGLTGVLIYQAVSGNFPTKQDSEEDAKKMRQAMLDCLEELKNKGE